MESEQGTKTPVPREDKSVTQHQAWLSDTILVGRPLQLVMSQVAWLAPVSPGEARGGAFLP